MWLAEIADISQKGGHSNTTIESSKYGTRQNRKFSPSQRSVYIMLVSTGLTLRKLAHAINRDFLALKIENFQLINFDIFLIFAQNIDCGYTLEPPRRGGSNEYPQSMFWSKNKKNRYTPVNPSFII